MERHPHSDSTPAEWRDWRWQHRHALRTPEAVGRIVRLTEDERRGLLATAGAFRLGITPYYAALMDAEHPFCPIRMQAIPRAAEVVSFAGDLRDPLGEDHHRPARAIVHKYPDRVLFLVSDTCSVYCRHCTRRRITSGEEGAFDRAAAEEGLEYVRAHPEVRDVLISGGDPLVLSDERIAWLLESLRTIRHIELVRVATRMPVTCPMRITEDLARLLRAHKPVFVVTHFNHPKECTEEAAAACETLVDHGVPVENQTVLLRQVNSSARTIRDLNQRLLTWRVRPYYLHQGDVVEGTAHLRTPLACGIEIIEKLRGWTSGLAVPHLAVDLPGGGGKVTVQPEYRLSGETAPAGAGASPGGAGGTWFRGYAGGRWYYPEPPEQSCDCPYDEVYYGHSGARRPGQ